MRLNARWSLPLVSGVSALVLLLAGITGIGQSHRAFALTNCSVSDISLDSEEQAFLGLINQYRAQNGLGALGVSTNLDRSATWLAIDMGQKNYFSHTDQSGRSPSTRAMDCGYPQGAGENIAAGTNWSTASSVFAAWKASSGHNANMLNGSYKQIGIARAFTSGSTYGWYWVTDFGLTNDGTNGGGGSGATATATSTRPPAATATPTQPPAQSGPASISSPSQGSTLPGASATFSWNAVSGGLEYFLYVGTSAGSNNLLGASTGTATSRTVSNLPTTGGTVYVRLWTRFASGWQFRDTTYNAANAGSGGGGTQDARATLTSPANGSRLSSTSATFQWSAGSGAQEYFFYLGTSPGANNLIGASMGLGRSITLSNLPTGGQPLYIRIWTRFASGWQYNDYTVFAP
jgi:hypothetical protein